MTITNGYCTLAEIKAPLNIPTATTTEDTILERMVESVSRAIDNECARFFYKDTNDVTFYFVALASDHIYFGDFVSVTTLSTDLGSGTYQDWTVDTDYNLWPYNVSTEGKPYMGIETAPRGRYSFPIDARKGVRLVYKRGWPSVPRSITEACIRWCERTYELTKAPLGISAMTALGQMTIKVPPPDPDVKSFIANYSLNVYS